MAITSAPSVVEPDDLATIEAIPRANRDLPISTYDAVLRAARRWPGRQALAVRPDGATWGGRSAMVICGTRRHGARRHVGVPGGRLRRLS